MAAAAHSGFATSAAVFAGGLAVGIGGAFALSRSVFAPSTKPTRATQHKVRRDLSLPSGTDKDASANDVTAQSSAVAAAKGEGLQSITGKYVQPTPRSKAQTSATRMDLLRHDGQDDAKVPVWLTGSQTGSLLSTSAGQIEKIACRSSRAVFVYDSAGFGSDCEEKARQADAQGAGHPKVISMQTRVGAGAAIAGYLSETGASSHDSNVIESNVVTALVNADGFLAMAPSLAGLLSSNGRLVVQVSAASQEREQIGNNYAAVLAAAATAGEQLSVVLSGGRQEAVEVAGIVSASNVQGHVAHVFYGAFAGASIAKLQMPDASPASKGASVTDALHAAGFENFVYAGAQSPHTLLVVPNGSHFDAARAVLAKSSDAVQQGLGLLAVRIVRPWSDEDFLKLIPSSVECVHVLDEVRVAGTTGVLYEDVQATMMANIANGPTPIVQPIALQAGESLSAVEWTHLLSAAAQAAHYWQLDLEAIKRIDDATNVPALLDESAQLITFVDSDTSSTAWSGPLLARSFRDRNGEVRQSRIQSQYDNFEAGGLMRHDVLLSPPTAGTAGQEVPLALAAVNGQSSTLVIGDLAVIKSYDIFQSLKQGGTVVINAPGLNGGELAAKLRAEDKRALASKAARVYLLDTTKVVERIASATAAARGGKHRMQANEVPKETAAVAVLSVILDKQLFFNSAHATTILSKVLGIAPLGVGGVSGVVEGVASGLMLVGYSRDDWKKSEPVNETEANAAPRPSKWRYNGFGPLVDAASVSAEPSTTRATWALPAWQSIFSEAYKTDSAALRPDLPEDNYVLTVTENRRLTPLDYDRNVFHMELSTVGTGLKYEVGEALGIHGWNDEKEVHEFLEWSGYDPNEIISVASLNDPTRYESRTVFQIVQQRLDLFGKPPKRFYEVLSTLATDPDEAKWLRFVGSAEGQATFKKLSEIETVTYADVLRMFPSARVPLDVLLSEVEDIKPRHYSIASAQSFVGDSVHLLIVTFDWMTPGGSPRFGQCTRYLANLKIGDQVTVSLKPSVMKLPAYSTQPIVMSGLGTGAAPFRAYIQARAVQKRNGEKIGPMIYIFGSRYKYAEYLYGEELEAYEKDGIVKVLTAFSRDQKHKIYIQNRIEEGQKEILDLLMPKDSEDESKQGLFTLCGPTDPLPDVQEALIKGYMNKTGKSHADGEAWLEELKEKELAVYEVY